ncbi:unnamed protein product [Paramecium sonneborni]|uniref:Transmembrane protein n=1 Tax=Paramecium sonneborni TaxID=65129 RepID=A0A8S1Q913_9CILI|nr:unnamed protein product [Paramecium sonneborni]
MQNQYFVKGLGFAQRQEPQETRSYGRIKKSPYSAYNNRSYNLNYRDIRNYNDRFKRLIQIVNQAIKNQAATMFKYLSIYVQNKQQEEIKAQQKVIQDGLLRFQHAISLYNHRLKCLGFLRLAKVDVVSHLKKELRNQKQQTQQPLTHQIFRKWMQLTFEQKFTRLLKQQKLNMISFYQFTLNKILTKEESLKSWSFNKLKTAQRKQIINKLITNIGLQQLRLSLFNSEEATYQYLIKPQNLQKIIAFQKLKHFQYFNSNQHYFILIFTNTINSKINALRTLFIQSIRIIDQEVEHTVPKEQLQQFDIELARLSVHSKLEHQKMLQRQLKQTDQESHRGICEILKYIVNKQLYPIFYQIKGLKQSQDAEVQDGTVKNLSVIAARLSQKIKAKNGKSQKLEIIFRIEQIFRRNYHHEREILRNKFKQWQINITFPTSLYHDFEIRLRVLRNEKEAIMGDIEQLEILNNELLMTMNQVKKTFLSEESNFNTSHKNEQKQIEIQRFDIQENLTTQKEFKIAFEYVDYLKEDNINLKKQFQKNEQLMMEEIQQLELQLQNQIIESCQKLFFIFAKNNYFLKINFEFLKYDYKYFIYQKQKLVEQLNMSKSLMPASKKVIKQELQLNCNIKSLTNIPQSTNRIQEKQFQIKYSFIEINNETLTKRSNYHSILNDKKFSLAKIKDRDSELDCKLKELKLINLDKSQPKGILKPTNSKSKDHSNDHQDIFEQKQIHTKRIKFSSLKPIKSPYVQINTDIIETLSPKKVSFNTQVHIKLIEEKFQFKPKRQCQQILLIIYDYIFRIIIQLIYLYIIFYFLNLEEKQPIQINHTNVSQNYSSSIYKIDKILDFRRNFYYQYILFINIS